MTIRHLNQSELAKRWSLSPTRSHKAVTTSPSSALSSELRPGSHCSMPLSPVGV